MTRDTAHVTRDERRLLAALAGTNKSRISYIVPMKTTWFTSDEIRDTRYDT
ncbi:MAG: hypothetical protein PHW46_06755 [Candidatus Omnitrophica bacterium]|nr:hypothetical protein [Candidatus Omnitrophota bacterium]